MAFRPPDWLRFEFFHGREQFQQKWQQFTVRRWINNKPKAVIAISSISVLILLVVIIIGLDSEEPPTIEKIDKEWFYDLNTGELFTAKKGLIPPIEAPSGPLPDGQPAGVRAYVLAYVYEPNETDRFIAFLETTDPEEQTQEPLLADNSASGLELWGRGKLIRRVEDKWWVPANSIEGSAILEEAFRPNENGERPNYCRPK